MHIFHRYVGKTGPMLAASLLWCSAAAHAQLAVDADTVALWHFDDGSGTQVNDEGLNNLDMGFARYPADGSQGAQYPA